MANRNRPSDPRDPRGPDLAGPSGSSAGIVRIATLVGVGVLVLMNLKTMSDSAGVQKSLGEANARIADMNNRVVALGTQVQNVAKAATPPRQGPDPNKVYPIKLEGAPSEGPANAPVVIAEFSDFQ